VPGNSYLLFLPSIHVLACSTDWLLFLTPAALGEIFLCVFLTLAIEEYRSSTKLSAIVLLHHEHFGTLLKHENNREKSTQCGITLI
jgi:hypothetical protein